MDAVYPLIRSILPVYVCYRVLEPRELCMLRASALELSSIPALTILSLGLTMYFTLVLFLLCINTSASGFQSPRFIDVCFLLTYLCLITVMGGSLCFHFTITLYRCHSFVWVHVMYVQCMCLGVCACVCMCVNSQDRGGYQASFFYFLTFFSWISWSLECFSSRLVVSKRFSCQTF